MIGRSNAVSGGIEWKDVVDWSEHTISLPFYPYNGETVMLRWDGISTPLTSGLVIPLEINSTTASAATWWQGTFTMGTALAGGQEIQIGNGGDGTVEITTPYTANSFPRECSLQYAIVK